MVVPAPAQDEREESGEALFEHYLQNAIDNAPEPLRRLGEHLSHVLDEDRWATAERLLNGAIVALTHRAQAEQQPVEVSEAKRYADYAALEAECERLSSAHNDASYYAARYEELRAAQTEQHPIYQIRPRENVRDWLDTNADGYRAAKAMASMEVRMLYAAPIAQATPAADMRDNYLDLLQEVLDAKEVMRAAGIEQGSFGAMFKRLAKQTATQPEQSGWVSVEDRLPEVAAGDEGEFIVCVYRSHNGESYSFSARFLNDYPLYTDYEDKPALHSGWYDVKEHADYDGWYSPLIDEKSGDKVTHWMPLPAAPALAAQGVSDE